MIHPRGESPRQENRTAGRVAYFVSCDCLLRDAHGLCEFLLAKASTYASLPKTVR